MRPAWIIAAGLLAMAPAPHRASAAPPPGLLLTGNGFTANGTAATFGRTSRARAIALAAAVLGAPRAQGSHGDCGQGDIIGYAKFRGDFELSFVKGRLSGWTADGPIPRTREGAAVGITLARLRRLYPHLDTDPGDEAHGGLGPSFGQDGGPNGWLSGTKPTSTVAGMFAGATCLAGV